MSDMAASKPQEKVVVAGLTKRFGNVVAVNNVSFEIMENEFFSLLGPSGCGKTTTLRCVAGLESADEGRIEIGGRLVYASAQGINVPANHRSIGMVFQNYAVWPHMSVFDNIAYPLKVAGLRQQEIRNRVERVLAMLAMEGLENRMPNQLSGGQQQRVALGRALAMNPQVLLLDEPLSNLDAKLREMMRVELKRIQKETGIPILYVTHDQTEALAMSDRIAVMSGGVIHQLGRPEEIYNQPRTPFVLDFIGVVNYIPCRIALSADGGARILLPDGQEAVVGIVAGTAAAAHGAGQLGVRPEDIDLLDPVGAPAGTVKGEVEFRSFLGSTYEYRVRVGELALRVQTGKNVHFREGARVAVRINHGHFLAAETGATGQRAS